MVAIIFSLTVEAGFRFHKFPPLLPLTKYQCFTETEREIEKKREREIKRERKREKEREKEKYGNVLAS